MASILKVNEITNTAGSGVVSFPDCGANFNGDVTVNGTLSLNTLGGAITVKSYSQAGKPSNPPAGTTENPITNEWSGLFGDEVLGSTFQDGHYVYTVVAGGGTGSDVYPPVVYVVDVENATDFNNVLEP